MSEYYGAPSTPTSDFLAHYGVRGMKWGVRKAIHKGSEKAMAKQYRKAQKKLDKLNKRADIKRQQNEMEYHAGKTYRSAAGSIAANTAGIGTMHIHNAILRSSANTKDKLGALAGTEIGVLGLAGVGLGLLGKETYHAGKAIAAKHRTTQKGHAIAVAKRDAWKKEMKSAFKGTQYDASRGSLKKRK